MKYNIRKLLFICILVNLIIPSVSLASSNIPKNELIEETLLIKLNETLTEVTSKRFYCEKIVEIARSDSSTKHDLTIKLVTFEGAHNPPYDRYTIKLHDTLEGTTVTDVEIEKNVKPKTTCKYF